MVLEMSRVQNALQVRRSWRSHWPGIPAPSAVTIKNNYLKFVNHGTSLNRNRGNSRRPRTARSQQNIARVRRSLRRNVNISSRRNGLGISRSSFNRIVRQDILFNPYVLVKRQELRPNDPAQRPAFCNWFKAECNNNPNFLRNVLTLDEAVFSLDFEVNTRNVVKYSLMEMAIQTTITLIIDKGLKN